MQKQSTAIIWLIHSLEVLALGAVVTCVVTIYQAFAAGNFSLATAGVMVASALGAFGLNGIKGILGNANFAQAVADLRAELAAAHQQQPPVVIHNHMPDVATQPAPPPAQPPAPVPLGPLPSQPQFVPSEMAAFVTSEMPAVTPQVQP